MKFEATLSKTTTDIIKSKLMNREHAQIVFDVYLKPNEYSALIDTFYDRSFTLEVS